MPKEVRDALTATKVRQEKRPGRYADGNGLYLHVSKTGARWWLWRGTVHGIRCERGMGSARILSLAEAREIARDVAADCAGRWRSGARARQGQAPVHDIRGRGPQGLGRSSQRAREKREIPPPVDLQPSNPRVPADRLASGPCRHSGRNLAGVVADLGRQASRSPDGAPADANCVFMGSHRRASR